MPRLTKVLVLLTAVCLGLLVAIAGELAQSVGEQAARVDSAVQLANGDHAPTTTAATLPVQSWQRIAASRHLFQPSAKLPTRRQTARSVEQVRSRLKLRGVLAIAGKPVAYVEVKGLGLKQFSEGDQTDDFKVVRITPRLVQLEILGEEVSLQ
jgi:hypothetical protein